MKSLWILLATFATLSCTFSQEFSCDDENTWPFSCKLTNYIEGGVINFVDSVEKRDKTTFITIIKANIPQIPNGIFTNYKNIQDFTMSGCGLLEITKNSFTDAAVLETLILTYNNLTALNSNIFTNLKILNSIYLSNNKIEKISPDAFQGLENLRHLFLDSNNIKVIEKGTFNNLHLDSLYLSKNQLVDFDFQNLNIPENLYLSNNLLISLTVMGNITHLEANNNKITTVSIETNTLVFLSVVNNSITDVSSIKNGENLKQLDLSNNQIVNPALKGLTNLKTLVLSNNKLSGLTKETFLGLTNLETLAVNNNKGMKIDSWEILKPLINLTEISFDKSHLEDYTFEKMIQNNPKIKYVVAFEEGVPIVYDSIYMNIPQLLNGPIVPRMPSI